MMSANISLSVADWKTSFSLNYVNKNLEGRISDVNESSNKSLTVMIWSEMIRILNSFTM